MKITKSQLKQIIKEELDEGILDTIASRLGYGKKPVSKEDEILDKIEKIRQVRRQLLDLEIDEIVDQLPEGIRDEVGEEGSVELELWEAIADIYKGINRTTAALRDASEKLSTEHFQLSRRRETEPGQVSLVPGQVGQVSQASAETDTSRRVPQRKKV